MYEKVFQNFKVNSIHLFDNYGQRHGKDGERTLFNM